MIGDNFTTIKGGTKFYELDRDINTMQGYEYDQEQEEPTETNEYLETDLPNQNYKQMRGIQTSPHTYMRKQSQSLKNSSNHQSSKNSMQPWKNQEVISQNYRIQTTSKQQNEPNLKRVEERLILMGKRKEERLEKQREIQYSQILRPAPCITNKENKPAIRTPPNDVYERLFASSRKAMINSKLSQQGQMIVEFTRNQGFQIGLDQIIKPMPEYNKKQVQETTPIKILNVQSTQLLKSQGSSNSKQIQDLQVKVFQSYLNQNKSNYLSNMSSSKYEGSPFRMKRPQSYKPQQKGIIDQCMDAYLKKQKSRFNEQLQ